MSEQIRYSCLYSGWVRHRRFRPLKHSFVYPLFMAYLDLDEVQDVMKSRWFCGFEKRNLVSFFRRDYFQSGADSQTAEMRQSASLKRDVIDAVNTDAQRQGITLQAITRVCLLTHLRMYNLLFNPVSIYYCYDRDDQLQAVVAEITNTPWGERHSYFLYPGQNSASTRYERKGNNRHRFEFEKCFHVSPFNPMNMDYRWVFSEPDHACRIHMDNLMQTANHQDEEDKHFDATLSLQRKPLNEFGRTLIRYPFMCVSVVTGIYWQALKLWLKRAPFYDHPKLSDEKA